MTVVITARTWAEWPAVPVVARALLDVVARRMPEVEVTLVMVDPEGGMYSPAPG